MEQLAVWPYVAFHYPIPYYLVEHNHITAIIKAQQI
jgi:hypothetical protein